MKVLVVDEGCQWCDGAGLLDKRASHTPLYQYQCKHGMGQTVKTMRVVCPCVRAVELVAEDRNRIIVTQPDGTSDLLPCHYPLVEKP